MSEKWWNEPQRQHRKDRQQAVADETKDVPRVRVASGAGFTALAVILGGLGAIALVAGVVGGEGLTASAGLGLIAIALLASIAGKATQIAGDVRSIRQTVEPQP